MTKAHEGVPVASLPGAEIVPYLLAQTPPSAESGGWGNFAANNPDGASANEQRTRNWIFRDNDNPPPQQQIEPVNQRGGFFRRLFGG